MSSPASDPDQPAITTHRRRRGSALDLLRSMGIVGVAVVALVTLTFRDEPQRPPVTTDVRGVITLARSEASFPVLAATTLPAGWYANAARYGKEGVPEHLAFHVGYTDGETAYVGVEATVGDDGGALTAGLGEATGTRTIAGVDFSVHRVGDDRYWLHRATAEEPWNLRISASDGSEADAVISALAPKGAVTTELPSAS